MLQTQIRDIRVRPPQGVSLEEVKFTLSSLNYHIIEEEEDDFYYELSDEDLKKIEIGREQIKMGLGVKNEEIFEKIRKRREERWK